MTIRDEAFWNDVYAKGTDYIEVSAGVIAAIGKRFSAGASFLDLGCGTGAFMRKLEAIGLTTKGIEVSSEAIRIARQRGTHGDLVLADLEQVGEAGVSGKFQVIGLKLVLAFISNRARLLTWCRDHVAEGGILCVTTPVSSKERPFLKRGIEIDRIEVETLLGLVFGKVETIEEAETVNGLVNTYFCYV